jgi:hypothetical protein
MYCAVSVVLLSQCDDWNKPLIERIKKSTDEQKTGNIQELIITQFPWPNTFNTGEMEPIHYDNPDWPAGSWEEMGLEVCAILKTGGWQKLTPDNYIITGFDSQTPAEKEIISVYAKDDPEKSAEFPIIILDNGTEYKSVSPYQGAGGKIIPYPSKVALGSGATVSLHIYPDNGYVLDGGSLKIETAEGGSAAYKAEGGVYIFTMPDSDVTLNAKFVNKEAKLESGGSVTYYDHLKESLQDAGSGGGGVITLLKTPVYIDETIMITGGNDITLASDMWKEQEIHWGGLAGGNMTSMIEVESGASLTLDGSGGELVIDGAGFSAAERLVKVAGAFTVKDGVTLKNSKGGGVYVNGGKFTMYGGEISGNTAYIGGGVSVSGGGEFTMSGGEISGNTAGQGGGGGVNVEGGIFTLSGGEISGNTAYVGGAVVVNGGGGTFTMIVGEISGNMAGYGGGGVFVNGGTFTLSGGAVSGNTAGHNGGGVVVIYGQLKMSGGEISGNTAEYGAGVYTDGNFSMSRAAFVAQDNVVCLADGRQITVTGILAPSMAAPNLDGGKIAKIAVSDANTARLVVAGFSAEDIDKFSAEDGKIVADGLEGWFIPANNEASITTAAGSITNYETLSEAVAGAPSGKSVITLLSKTITLTNTVSIAICKNITFTIPDSETYTIKRASSSMTAGLFAVASGASLTLDGSGGGMIIDGADAG